MSRPRYRGGELWPRRCARCRTPHAAAAFATNGARVLPWCRQCAADYQRAYQAANADRLRVAKAARYVANLEDNRAKRRKYRLAHLAQDTKRSLRHRARRQAQTLETAERRGAVWAGWEYEAISDYSRTAAELALSLGRTLVAVQRQRGLLKRGDPKTVNRAGLPETKSGF